MKNMFYDKFKNTGRISDIINKADEENKYYVDTVLINKIILKEEGLEDKNIIDSKICTKCRNDKLHSYRGEGEKAGRNTGLICLERRNENE